MNKEEEEESGGVGLKPQAEEQRLLGLLEDAADQEGQHGSSVVGSAGLDRFVRIKPAKDEV